MYFYWIWHFLTLLGLLVTHNQSCDLAVATAAAIATANSGSAATFFRGGSGSGSAATKLADRRYRYC